jgi:hypothetical protein
VDETSPTQPLPTQINPRVAFERLFGDGASAEERLTGRKQNASILDSVTREIPLLKKDLGAGDRARLDTYLENIREVERRVQAATSGSVKEPSEDVPFGPPESKHVHYRLMYDLLALAFEGDITRSATFMLGRDLTTVSFPESGFNGGWHGSSHHGDNPENIANYAKINRYHVQHLAYFCEKLRNIPEGDGTVLDHVLIYKGSNMGNSHRHGHEKCPVILVGGLDGTFTGNRHLVFPDQMIKGSEDIQHAVSVCTSTASSRTVSARARACSRSRSGNVDVRLPHMRRSHLAFTKECLCNEARC